MNKNTEEIIKSHVLWSLGGGLIPLPVVDFVAVTSIQLDLVKQLCEIHEVSYQQRAGKSLVSALAGTTLAQLGASAIKSLPGVGSALGSVSMSLMSGATTYALGKVFQTHFSRGGTLDNFNTGQFKELFEDMKKEGLEKAKAWKSEEKKDPKVVTEEQMKSELEKLDLLKTQEIIDDKEYSKMRKKVLDSYVTSH